MTTKDLKAFETLFGISHLRGPHSTGLMTYNTSKFQKKRPVKIKKALGPSPLFIQKENSGPVMDNMLDSIFNEVMMGHCRYATVGNINVDNAHPFDTGSLVSAQNGTLIDGAYTKDKEKTDSQMMFEDMEVRGIKPVLDGLSRFSAYAISVFNKKSKTLTFARNDDRELALGISKDRDVMFWASESAMLRFIAARHKINLEYYDFTPGEIFSVQIDQISHKKHSFWDVEEVKPKPIWSTSTTTTEDKKAPWDDPLIFDHEEWCSTCGQVLWGRMIEQSERVVFDKMEYFTCRECVEAGIRDAERQRVKKEKEKN